MHVPMFKRAVIATFNIIFPPVAVAMLTGFSSPDTLLNCILFLLAIIPSHIHGFYISMTYFNRKRRVRRGQYPGGDRTFIYSEKVVTGGAGYREARKLKRERDGTNDTSWNPKEDDLDMYMSSGNTSRRSSRRRQSSTNRRSRPVSTHDPRRRSHISQMDPTSPRTSHLSRQSTRMSGMSQIIPVSPLLSTSHQRAF